MFGLGFVEIVVIALVIMLVVKPEDLPKLFKKIGNAYGEIKKTVGEVKKMKDDFVKIADDEVKAISEVVKKNE